MTGDEVKDGFVGKMDTGGGAGEQLVAQGAALVKLENMTQMQVSIQRPRDEAKILAAALKELDTYPAMAEEVMYHKPVGKEDGVMKYADGLSIRAAESLSNRWANSAYGCDIISEDKEGVTIAAVFMDYENNTRHVISKKVSRTYMKANKTIATYGPDRFADVTIPAGQSKILREAILRSLPAGLKQEYEDKARAIMLSGDAKKLTTKLVAGFIRLGVSKSKLEELAGKKIDDLSREEIASLIATGNAIRDGETSLEQLIVEKNNAEKLQDAFVGGAGSGPAKSPDASGQVPRDPGAQTSTASTPAAPNVTGSELTGAKLALYELASEKGAGDLFETNAVLAKHSSGLIKDKTDLIKADDALVASVTKKMQKG